MFDTNSKILDEQNVSPIFVVKVSIHRRPQDRIQWITDRESPRRHHSRPLDFDPNPRMRYNC